MILGEVTVVALFQPTFNVVLNRASLFIQRPINVKAGSAVHWRGNLQFQYLG